jgi:hypothetical protein
LFQEEVEQTHHSLQFFILIFGISIVWKWNTTLLKAYKNPVKNAKAFIQRMRQRVKLATNKKGVDKEKNANK